ncbi:hypothetical protein ABTM83_19280, partial [Acinetobacter baumannii]
MAVTVSAETLPLAAPLALEAGTATTQVQGRIAGVWTLAAGPKRLQLDLPAATAVVLDGGSAPTTIWSGLHPA